LDFVAEPVKKEWDKDKLAKLRQLNLFETSHEGKFEVVKKLPYKFSFVFKDNQGKKSNLMIEDWETGQLYWNCLARHEGNEQMAISDVRKKYFDDFAKTKDLYFFLGTTKLNHFRAPNPFIIIGTFHPKKEIQRDYFEVSGRLRCRIIILNLISMQEVIDNYYWNFCNSIMLL